MSDLDIRSVWVKRPDPLSGDSRAFYGIHVDCMVQRDGSELWAIHSGDDMVLGKDSVWVFEQRSSNREEQYIRRYRWPTMAEAIAFAEKYL